MRIKNTKKLDLAKERLQTLTPAELTEVSGGKGPSHRHGPVHKHEHGHGHGGHGHSGSHGHSGHGRGHGHGHKRH
jgi:hypothetical protein